MRLLLPLFLFITSPLASSEAETMEYKPFDFTQYNDNPMTQLNGCWQSAKRRLSVVGTSHAVNVMDIQGISDEGIAFLSNERSEKVAALKDSPEAALLMSWDSGGKRPSIAKIKGKVDFSYKHPSSGTKEISINGEKRSVNWISYRLVPSTITFVEYAYPNDMYTLAQFVTYIKQDGGWSKVVNSKPCIIINPS